MVELADMARAAIGAQRGGAMFAVGQRATDEAELSARLSGGGLLVVGKIDDAVVGFGSVRFDDREGIGVVGVIDGLFVEPAARSIGVGESIVEEILRHGEDAGCIGWDAFALPGDRTTKNFFETMGFKARLLVMHRSAAP